MLRKLQTLIAVALTFNMASQAFAVGASAFSTQFAGAKALGQGNAFVAEADDPSAVYYNPAGMTQLKGAQLSIGSTFLVPYTERTGNNVPDDQMKRQVAAVPNFYATTALPSWGEKKMAAGIGVTSPYGLSTDWAPTSSVRYVTTTSNFEMLNINPSFAMDVLSNLSLGAGIDYVSLMNTTAKSQIPDLGGLEPDGTSELKGHGSGWGYNVGVLYKPVEKHSLGLSYRSQVKVPITGNVNLSNLSTTDQALFNFASANYTAVAHSSVILPASILGGYAFKPTDQWTLLLDYEWTQWNVFQNQDVAFDESDNSGGLSGAGRLGLLTGGTGPNANVSRTVRQWHNVSAVGGGVNYKINEAWQVRGGYAYYEKAVPNDTFSPDVPDASNHLFTAGCSRTWDSFVVDFAFNAYYYVNRSVNDNVGSGAVNGTYKTFVPALALNLTYKFSTGK